MTLNHVQLVAGKTAHTARASPLTFFRHDPAVSMVLDQCWSLHVAFLTEHTL